MDLRTYYQKIRDVEATILEEFPVVVSRLTGDGGKGGVASEVNRRVAAKMVVEDSAQLASPEEARVYQEQQLAGRKAAQERAAAARMEVTVVSAEDMRKLRGGSKVAKE